MSRSIDMNSNFLAGTAGGATILAIYRVQQTPQDDLPAPREMNSLIAYSSAQRFFSLPSTGIVLAPLSAEGGTRCPAGGSSSSSSAFQLTC